MLKSLLITAVMSLAAVVALAADLPGKTHRVFYLAEMDGKVSVESLVIAEGETTVLKDDRIISFIIPFAPGSKSGDLSSRSDRGRPISIRCRNGMIEASLRNPDGSLLRDLPAFELAEARQLDVRINITAHDGSQSAQRILGWETVVADHGPVLDMFAGRVPMNPGDYSIMIETLAAERHPDLKGVIPLVPIDHWLTADATLEGGRRVRLLLDLGATTSALDARALPAGTVVTPYQMVEYSDKGRLVSDAVVPGAGGMTSNISGTASLLSVGIGDLVLTELPVVVIEKFPEQIAEKGVDGILGIDQIRQAGRIVIGPASSGNGRVLRLGDSIGRLPPADHAIPFTEADNKLFFKGTVNEAPVDLILDSGALQSVLEPSIIGSVTTPLRETGTRHTGTGLDGTPIEMKEVEADELSIGDCRMEDFRLLLANLPVLATMGLTGEAGLLGADFFSRFERIEIDFTNKRMRLWIGK